MAAAVAAVAAGSPCLRAGSTKSSLARTSLPANWRSLRRSHMAEVVAAVAGVAAGSPCLRAGSTKSSLARTSLPANWRSLHCSRKARKVAEWEDVWEDAWEDVWASVGTLCQHAHSTTTSC